MANALGTQSESVSQRRQKRVLNFPTESRCLASHVVQVKSDDPVVEKRLALPKSKLATSFAFHSLPDAMLPYLNGTGLHGAA